MRNWIRPLLAVLAVMFFASPVFAAEEAGAGLVAVGAGLGLGLAGLGAGLGQGRAVAAAMESIGRNPNAADRVFTPMIVGLAFMEALAIYGLVVALMSI